MKQWALWVFYSDFTSSSWYRVIIWDNSTVLSCFGGVCIISSCLCVHVPAGPGWSAGLSSAVICRMLRVIRIITWWQRTGRAPGALLSANHSLSQKPLLLDILAGRAVTAEEEDEGEEADLNFSNVHTAMTRARTKADEAAVVSVQQLLLGGHTARSGCWTWSVIKCCVSLWEAACD